MTNTQESANRVWWGWCSYCYWRWWKWCWWLSTEPADIRQKLDIRGKSWSSHNISRNPGILVTVELEDLVQRVTWVHIVMWSPSSYISLSNFRLNLWFLEITKQVNLIIDGQSNINNQVYLLGNFSKFLSWKNLIAARWDTWVVYCDGSGYKLSYNIIKCVILARVFLAVTNLAVKVWSLFVCLSCMKTLIDST